MEAKVVAMEEYLQRDEKVAAAQAAAKVASKEEVAR